MDFFFQNKKSFKYMIFLFCIFIKRTMSLTFTRISLSKNLDPSERWGIAKITNSNKYILADKNTKKLYCGHKVPKNLLISYLLLKYPSQKNLCFMCESKNIMKIEAPTEQELKRMKVEQENLEKVFSVLRIVYGLKISKEDEEDRIVRSFTIAMKDQIMEISKENILKHEKVKEKFEKLKKEAKGLKDFLINDFNKFYFEIKEIITKKSETEEKIEKLEIKKKELIKKREELNLEINNLDVEIKKLKIPTEEKKIIEPVPSKKEKEEEELKTVYSGLEETKELKTLIENYKGTIFKAFGTLNVNILGNIYAVTEYLEYKDISGSPDNISKLLEWCINASNYEEFTQRINISKDIYKKAYIKAEEIIEGKKLKPKKKREPKTQIILIPEKPEEAILTEEEEEEESKEPEEIILPEEAEEEEGEETQEEKEEDFIDDLISGQFFEEEEEVVGEKEEAARQEYLLKEQRIIDKIEDFKKRLSEDFYYRITDEIPPNIAYDEDIKEISIMESKYEEINFKSLVDKLSEILNESIQIEENKIEINIDSKKYKINGNKINFLEHLKEEKEPEEEEQLYYSQKLQIILEDIIDNNRKENSISVIIGLFNRLLKNLPITRVFIMNTYIFPLYFWPIKIMGVQFNIARSMLLYNTYKEYKKKAARFYSNVIAKILKKYNAKLSAENQKEIIDNLDNELEQKFITHITDYIKHIVEHLPTEDKELFIKDLKKSFQVKLYNNHFQTYWFYIPEEEEEEEEEEEK